MTSLTVNRYVSRNARNFNFKIWQGVLISLLAIFVLMPNVFSHQFASGVETNPNLAASNTNSNGPAPNNSTKPTGVSIWGYHSHITTTPNGILVLQFHIPAGPDPIGSENQLFNITSDSSNVLTTIDSSSTYNDLYGGSCTVNKPAQSRPPCNPTDGMFSYQFNVEFPKFNNGFFLQDVIEFNLNTNSCYAQTNGGNQYSFACSSATSYGNYFEWTISSSSGYFTSTTFYLNGQLDYTATSQQIFGCTSCASMTNTYGQSVFVGWGSTSTQDGSYANFYNGQGTMQYAGMSLYSSKTGGTIYFTGETSNEQFTTPYVGGEGYYQTFLGGSVAATLSGYGTYGHGSVTNPSNVLGNPDGKLAQIYGGNSGDGGYIKAQLINDQTTSNNEYSGFLVIDGYSYYNSGCGGCGYDSHVYVYTSSDGSTWTQVYVSTWYPKSGNPITWINIASVSNVKYVEIKAIDDNGYSANIYIDSVSVYLGSYIQSYVTSSTIGSGSVNNPSNIVGVPDGNLAQIYGGNPGDGGWIEGQLSSTFSGWVMIDGYSYYNSGCGGCGYDSHVYVFISSDGTNWQQIYVATWSPTSGNPITWFTIAFNVQNVKYVKIEAIDDNGYSANIYVDAIYVS